MNEARLKQTEHGLVPETGLLFVLNASEAIWCEDDEFGRYTWWRATERRVAGFGINIGVMLPGQPACMQHGGTPR